MYIVGVLSATEGKALPTELRKEEKALRHKIEMEDEVTEKPKVCMRVGKRSIDGAVKQLAHAYKWRVYHTTQPYPGIHR